MTTPLDQQTISDLSRFGLNADDRADKFASAFDAQAPLEELPTFAPLAERTDRQVFDSIENLLLDGLDVWRKILEARGGGGSESRSSATVKTSTRGVDLEVHSYSDGLLPAAVDDAIAEYARGQRKLLALQTNQWQETVEMVNGAKA